MQVVLPTHASNVLAMNGSLAMLQESFIAYASVNLLQLVSFEAT